MKNPRVSRRKEILKIREEINAKETKETIAKINKAKSCFFEKINEIDKPLARLIKKQTEKSQINKIRNENGEITIFYCSGPQTVILLEFRAGVSVIVKTSLL